MRKHLMHPDFRRLFGVSFLILFLELVCIRWLSAYILYLGYFTNFVLLGAFLGIGTGTLLTGRPTRLIRWLPIALYSLVVVTLFTRAQLNPEFENLIYFISTVTVVSLPPSVLLPIVFLGVSVTFALLAQELGFLLTKFRPLRAYTINILGSLAGIAIFTLISLLSIPAWVWFLLAAILIIPFLPRDRIFKLNLAFLLGIVLSVGASDFAFRNVWSPYYRLGLVVQREGAASRIDPDQPDLSFGRYVLLANGASHQEFTSTERTKLFYGLPYVAFNPQPEYQDVLIIGAGGGNDVAAALEHGVARVDAVEIDPRIIDLGRDFHPESPYQDPRVRVVVDDARSFLEKTDKTYDLIVFALPDSLVLASNLSGVRLESFLFTREAFQSVKEHLRPDGLFVLYNYFRSDWLVEKLGGMVAEVFGTQPVYHSYPDPEARQLVFVTIFAGPKTRELDASQPGFARAAEAHYVPATDDWPFLYLREPSLPVHYTGILALILLFSFLFVWGLSSRRGFDRSGWPFFFMGAAFMLLEAKSIVQFLLLFGATWIVNALVFFAILLAVLAANFLASRYRFSNLRLLYLLLFAALVANLALPLEKLLVENLLLRYGAATALLFSPIFFANLIYSTLFRDTSRANVAYGANILGTMLGGSIEYLALYLGYHNLAIIAGLFYFLAFYLILRAQRPNPSSTSGR